MAQPGRQYALGFDGAGSVKLDARALPAPAGLRCMNLHEGKWIDGGEVEPGWISLQTPGPGQWLAMILAP
jgi:hypothetical protein